MSRAEEEAVECSVSNRLARRLHLDKTQLGKVALHVVRVDALDWCVGDNNIKRLSPKRAFDANQFQDSTFRRDIDMLESWVRQQQGKAAVLGSLVAQTLCEL